MCKKPLLKMIISYGIVMLFSVTLILFTGAAAYKKGWDSIYERQAAALAQRAQLADNHVMEIMQDMQGLINNYLMINLPKPVGRLNPESYYDVFKVINYLKAYNVPDSMYIAYKDSQVVLSAKASFSLADFLNTQFFEPQIDIKEFEAKIFEKNLTAPWYFAFNSEKEDKTWIIIRQVLDYRYAAPKAVAFYVMQEEELLSFLGNFSSKEEGNSIIRDNQGHLIASHFPVESKQADRYVHSSISTIGGWCYELEQPKAVVWHNMWASMELMFRVLGVGLLVFVCGSILIYRRNTKMVSGMVNENIDLQKKLLEQIPYLRHDFYKNLLDGKFDSKEQMRISANLTGVNTEKSYYSVMNVEWRSGKGAVGEDKVRERQMEILKLKEQLKSFNAIAYIYDVSYKRFAIVLSEEKYAIKEQALKISQLIIARAKENQRQADIGLGTEKSDILEVSVSYNEAQCVLMNLSVCSKSGLKCYENLVLDGKGYSFSEQTRHLLFTAVCSGKTQETKEILEQITSSNVEQQNLEANSLRLFLLEFYSLVLRIRSTISIQDEVLINKLNNFSENYHHSEDLVRIEDIRQLLLDIVDYVGQSKKIYKDNLMYKIKDYLEVNYREPNMSLQFLAEKFEITESYLSHLFKKILNIKFFQYLEDLRMQEACRLLKSTELSVASIVEQTGYSSVNTFGRAFKRKYQMSPREYREDRA